MYLLRKSTSEIYYKIEVDNKEIKKVYSMFRIILQIVILNMIFSFGSIFDNSRND